MINLFILLIILMSPFLVVYTIVIFNLFQRLYQDIEKKYSDIETEETRKKDLLKGLNTAVDSYTDFEKGTFKDVTKERKFISDFLPEDLRSEGEKFKEFSTINAKVVTERYPKLKANQEYNRLLEEIRITENRLNLERKEFNIKVKEYNIYVKILPSNIIALIFGFHYVDYYKGVLEDEI